MSVGSLSRGTSWIVCWIMRVCVEHDVTRRSPIMKMKSRWSSTRFATKPRGC